MVILIIAELSAFRNKFSVINSTFPPADEKASRDYLATFPTPPADPPPGKRSEKSAKRLKEKQTNPLVDFPFTASHREKNFFHLNPNFEFVFLASFKVSFAI